MSPQAIRKFEYGKGTDIWSVGLIFYYLLTIDEPKNNSKLNAIDFQKLELSDIPQGFCPRGITLFKCIYMKMIVFDEKDRATVEQVIDDEAFRDYYQAVETQALAWQVDDLQEKNQLLKEELQEQSKTFQQQMAKERERMEQQLGKTVEKMKIMIDQVRKMIVFFFQTK